MSETKKKYSEKRLIQLTQEQEERMAAQSAQKIQAFVGELAQVQSRRCEVMVALLSSHVTKAGIQDVSDADVEACLRVAHKAVEADSRQKWADLKAMFSELGVHGPQPHLEWAAKRVGVELFEAPSLIQAPTIQTVEGTEAIQ